MNQLDVSASSRAGFPLGSTQQQVTLAPTVIAPATEDITKVKVTRLPWFSVCVLPAAIVQLASPTTGKTVILAEHQSPSVAPPPLSVTAGPQFPCCFPLELVFEQLCVFAPVKTLESSPPL